MNGPRKPRQPGAARCEGPLESWSPVQVRHHGVLNRRRVGAAAPHLVSELHDPSLILPLRPELLSSEEPLGRLARTAGLHVGGLLTRLPASRDDDGALDGGALLAVDVLGVAEAQRAEVVASQVDVPVGAVELHGQALFADAGDFAT